MIHYVIYTEGNDIPDVVMFRDYARAARFVSLKRCAAIEAAYRVAL